MNQQQIQSYIQGWLAAGIKRGLTWLVGLAVSWLAAKGVSVTGAITPENVNGAAVALSLFIAPILAHYVEVLLTKYAPVLPYWVARQAVKTPTDRAAK
jgi:hypothetical protein